MKQLLKYVNQSGKKEQKPRSDFKSLQVTAFSDKSPHLSDLTLLVCIACCLLWIWNPPPPSRWLISSDARDFPPEPQKKLFSQDVQFSPLPVNWLWRVKSMQWPWNLSRRSKEMSVWVTEPVLSQRHRAGEHLGPECVPRRGPGVWEGRRTSVVVIVLCSVKMHHWTHLKRNNIWFNFMETKVAKFCPLKYF